MDGSVLSHSGQRGQKGGKLQATAPRGRAAFRQTVLETAQERHSWLFAQAGGTKGNQKPMVLVMREKTRPP